jgi:hypothetical protein
LKTEQQILEKHVLYIRFIYEFCTVSWSPLFIMRAILCKWV